MQGRMSMVDLTLQLLEKTATFQWQFTKTSRIRVLTSFLGENKVPALTVANIRRHDVSEVFSGYFLFTGLTEPNSKAISNSDLVAPIYVMCPSDLCPIHCPSYKAIFFSVSLMDLEEGSLQFAGFNVVGCLSCCRRMNQEGVIDLIWIGYALSEGMRGFFNWRAR